MDSLKNEDNKNNGKINSFKKEVKSESSLNQIKENIKNKNVFNKKSKRTIRIVKNLNTLLGFDEIKNDLLFENGFKSDDEENIKDQNEIFNIQGRKSLGELDIKYLEQLEQEGVLEDINSEENFCINQVIEKWNYEKILLDNNIIDYNCKSNFFYFNFQLM